jgi:hypothetical protein
MDLRHAVALQKALDTVVAVLNGVRRRAEEKLGRRDGVVEVAQVGLREALSMDALRRIALIDSFPVMTRIEGCAIIAHM